MNALIVVAILGIGTALLPVSAGTEQAKVAIANEVIAELSSGAAFEACSGCKRNSLAFGIASGQITVVGDLTLGNGTCTGTHPNCVASACTYPATTVTIVNTSGSDKWYSHNGGSPRILIGPGGTLGPISYPAGSLGCGKQEYFAFWASSTGGMFPAAVWGWECTSCPQ